MVGKNNEIDRKRKIDRKGKEKKFESQLVDRTWQTS